MTEDEEFAELEQRLKEIKEINDKRSNCQHRWEQSEFGQKFWEPGTWQYTCRRCGAMNMFRMEQV